MFHFSLAVVFFRGFWLSRIFGLVLLVFMLLTPGLPFFELSHC